jgi:hypothetical protein
MRIRALSLAIVILVALPFSSAAQQRHHPPRQPAEGSIAVGGDVGLFVPADGAFGPSVALEGHADFYLTARVAARFDVDWTDPSFDRESSDSLRQVRLGGDVIYNWEGGKWHPFAGGGIAAHLIQEKDNGRDFGDSETKLGGALLGGIEYFFNRTATIKAEGRYQFVGQTRNGYDPSGLVLLIGLKQYF